MQREREEEIFDLATNYMTLYGVNVNMARAIPFIKDGLKPIARRTLYACHKYYGDKHVKASVLIGDIGKFSPHGDLGLNEIVAKMAQPFSNNVPYFDGDGNVGNLTTGDDFAASRYYGVKLSKFTLDVLFDEFDGKVDMIPNYDGTLTEPFTLPAKFPLILLNGQSGIGYSLSTDIPPYNLSEIVDATIKIINFDKAFRKAITKYIATHNDQISEFLSDSKNVFNAMNVDDKIIKALGVKKPRIHLVPDSPTGCDIFINGENRFMMQSCFDIDNANYIITIRNTPYMKYLDNIDTALRQMQTSVDPIPEILSAEEESEDVIDEFRYVIRCKQCNLMNVVNKLFKRVPGFRASVNANNMTVIDSSYRTKKFSAGQILGDWISQRFHCKRTWYLRDLVKKNKKLNMLEGKAFMLSPKNVDKTVEVFKTHKKAQIIDALVETYKGKVTSSQASYIYDLPLYRISVDEGEATKKEIKEVNAEIEFIKSVITDDDKIKDVIIDELNDIKNKYGSLRKSKIISNTSTDASSVGVVTIVPNGNVIFSEVENPEFISSDVKPITGTKVCLIDEFGSFMWVDTNKVPHNQEIPLTSIGQKKMGACVTAVSNAENNIIILTSEGRVKLMPISKLPSKNSSTPIIQMGPAESIVSIAEVRDTGDDILIYTSDGVGKRIKLSDIKPSTSITSAGRIMLNANNVSGMFTLNSNKPFIVYVTRLGRVRVNHSRFLVASGKYDDAKQIINLSAQDDLVAVFCCDDNQSITLHHIDKKQSTVTIKSLPVSTMNTDPVRPKSVPGSKVVRASIT